MSQIVLEESSFALAATSGCKVRRLFFGLMAPPCSEEPEPGPAPGVPDLVELEPSEKRADDEVALDLLLLVPPLDHAVVEEAEVGDDPAGEVGVEHGALAEDLEVHREVEAAAQQDGAL